MRGRVLGLLLLAAVVGVGGGLGVGFLRQPQPASGGTATPIAAVSPSVPVDPVPTIARYAPDIDYPTMPTAFDFGRITMRSTQATWVVPVPRGWLGYTVDTDQTVPRKQWARYDELRFRPPGEPTEGGYSLRVKLVNNRITPDAQVALRRTLLGDLDEVHYLDSNLDALKFTYRDGNNRLRYNYWRWFVVPGSSSATLEMSVVGRQADTPGLDALFSAFAGAVHASRSSQS